jgi:hypothetical protein
MSQTAQAVESGLLTTITWLAFGWVELGGIVHAFKDHSVGDGFAAVVVPPWAWYRSVEFFWHHTHGVEDNATNSSHTDGSFPPLNAEEESVVSRVFSKALKEPLTDDDLSEYKQELRSYAARTGKPVTGSDVKQFLDLARLGSAYHRELGRCLLASIDQGKPFISPKLEEPRDRMKASGTVRASRLDADFRNIDSAAHGTTLKDEFGHEHYPPTRDDVIRDLKEDDIVDDNFNRAAAIVDELARSR